jgi:hypothetical protein
VGMLVKVNTNSSTPLLSGNLRGFANTGLKHFLIQSHEVEFLVTIQKFLAVPHKTAVKCETLKPINYCNILVYCKINILFYYLWREYACNISDR